MDLTTMPTKTQIAALEQRLQEALRNNNFRTLDQLYHDQLIVTNSIGQAVGKHNNIEPFHKDHLSINNITVSEQEISVHANTSVASELLKIKGKSLGFPFEGTYRYLRVWKEFSEGWKVIAESSVTIYEGSANFSNE